MSNALSPLYPRVSNCSHCAKPFLRQNARHKCCTLECNVEASRRISALKLAERQSERTATRLSANLNSAPRKPRPKVSKPPRPLRVPDPLSEAIQAIRGRIRSDATREAITAELNKIKLTSGCVDCGYRGHPTALQFDHVRGHKIRAVSEFTTLHGALAEAAKCAVRCAICHSIKTWNWKQEIKRDRLKRELTILELSDIRKHVDLVTRRLKSG